VDNIYHSFVEFFKQSLRAELNRIADNLADGNCKTFDDYRYQVGVVHGITYAEQVFEELVKQLQEKE
jgi:hypothetical protein